MGPLLMTGLACFGAAIAIGLLASAAVLPAGPPATPMLTVVSTGPSSTTTTGRWMPTSATT